MDKELRIEQYAKKINKRGLKKSDRKSGYESRSKHRKQNNCRGWRKKSRSSCNGRCAGTN